MKQNNRYYGNSDEFLKQLCMEEIAWENDGKDGYDSNGKPKTLERLLWILDNYIDENRQPVYHPMDRGLIICYLVSVLANYEFTPEQIDILSKKVSETKVC